ncbi:hypothetical protein SCP_1303450 [Sparassis crispa]|uniref:Uncharacterized protein n=1 Tax=Sparassis crispa TaxID=139825 RepID=A0A401H2A9_9APHY|nr:hypothetical protein SCP_1303450 [Sparassis crispa]GBE88529.1 hypothetical protein SCP_1303450 [Sparassis crispa]
MTQGCCHDIFFRAGCHSCGLNILSMDLASSSTPRILEYAMWLRDASPTAPIFGPTSQPNFLSGIVDKDMLLHSST